MQPYFYILQNTKTGNYYAGAKWSKDANPNTLLIEYKTSSEKVSKSINDYTIRKIRLFDTPEQVIEYERRFLLKVDAVRNVKFDNMNYGNTPQQLNKKWFNNGVNSTLAYECPEGYSIGRILKKENIGKHGNQKRNSTTWSKGQPAWNKGVPNPNFAEMAKGKKGKTWKIIDGKRMWIEKNG